MHSLRWPPRACASWLAPPDAPASAGDASSWLRARMQQAKKATHRTTLGRRDMRIVRVGMEFLFVEPLCTSKASESSPQRPRAPGEPHKLRSRLRDW